MRNDFQLIEERYSNNKNKEFKNRVYRANNSRFTLHIETIANQRGNFKLPDIEVLENMAIKYLDFCLNNGVVALYIQKNGNYKPQMIFVYDECHPSKISKIIRTNNFKDNMGMISNGEIIKVNSVIK